MSEAVTPTLAPCLFCKTADAVTVVSGALLPGVIPEPGMGFWVRCTTCSLRGPWRPTEGQARTAWNGAVTAHMHDGDKSCY